MTDARRVEGVRNADAKRTAPVHAKFRRRSTRLGRMQDTLAGELEALKRKGLPEDHAGEILTAINSLGAAAGMLEDAATGIQDFERTAGEDPAPSTPPGRTPPPGDDDGVPLPDGYSMADFEADFIVDGRNPKPGIHPCKAALEAIQYHPQFPFPEGSDVAVLIPPGTFEDFGVNDYSGLPTYRGNVAQNPGNWGDIHIHLVAPEREKGGAHKVRIESKEWKNASGDSIVVGPDDDWPARISFHGFDISSPGRKCVGHGSRDRITADGFTEPPHHSPMGSQLQFYGCRFSAHSKAPKGGIANGNKSHQAKWAVHTFWTAPYFEDCDFDFDDLDEHASYAHHQAPYRSGFKRCTFRGIGGQLWQETCRDQPHPTSADWNKSNTWEGFWPGHGVTRFEDLVCSNEFNLVNGRASCAFGIYGTGRTVELENVFLRHDRPATQRDIVPVSASHETKGFMRCGPNTFISIGGKDNHHRERCKYPTYGASKGYLAKRVTMKNCGFVWGGNNNVEPCQIASVHEGASFEDVAFMYGDGTNMGGAKSNSPQIRLAEENVNGGNSNRVRGEASSDIGRVDFKGVNSPEAKAALLKVFPDMTPAQRNGEMVIVEGAMAVGKPGRTVGVASQAPSREYVEHPNG